MPLSSSTAFKELTDGNTANGSRMGQTSTEPLSFYGSATTGVGVACSTIVGANYATSIVGAINATTASVTTWAFASSTQANALIGLLDWAYRAGIIR